MSDKALRGNIEVITDITDYLQACLDLYVSDHKEPIDAIDVFMAAHNFHKFVAMAVAKKLAPQVPIEHTLKQADVSFRAAIREMRLPKTVS